MRPNRQFCINIIGSAILNLQPAGHIQPCGPQATSSPVARGPHPALWPAKHFIRPTRWYMIRFFSQAKKQVTSYKYKIMTTYQTLSRRKNRPRLLFVCYLRHCATIFFVSEVNFCHFDYRFAVPKELSSSQFFSVSRNSRILHTEK